MKKYPKEIDKLMNPCSKENYDPETFDYMASSAGEEWKRERVIPPKELPTCGIKPKEIREGQMIGVYEGTQNIYLIFAYRTNELQKEVDELKKKVELLEKRGKL